MSSEKDRLTVILRQSAWAGTWNVDSITWLPFSVAEVYRTLSRRVSLPLLIVATTRAFATFPAKSLPFLDIA